MPRLATPWLLGLVFLVACGGNENLELCHADCSAKARCTAGFGEAEAAACHAGCDGKPGCFSDQNNDENKVCRNAPDLRAQKLGCYSRACEEISTCVLPLAINQQNPLCLRN